jgi:RNA polymerase sigma factor (sigma-70 family)
MEYNYTNGTSLNDQQTAELLKAFVAGNTTAFTRLYSMHVNMLYNYGCRLTTDMELLKDCIQDVFIKIYNKQSELDSVLNFKSYLYISLKNKLCDESRKRIHLSGVAVEELDIVSGDSVEKDYIAHENTTHTHSFIARMLDKLSPRQRQAIEMYYIEEQKYEDICVVLNMNYQSVRNLIHRGMTKMRACAVL